MAAEIQGSQDAIATQQHRQIPSVSETQLTDLRHQFRLLEGDRRAYYASSMKSMKENKALLSELQTRVKGLKKELKRARTINKGENFPGDDADLQKVEKHVTTVRRNLDMVKSQVDARRAELQQLRDHANEIGVAPAGSNGGSKITASPKQMSKVRALENRLDRAIIKYNEAAGIGNTYDQIAQRLKEERDTYESQLGAIERTTNAKNRDCDELRNLASEANQARDAVLKTLRATQDRIDTERRERRAELQRKREVAEMGKQVLTSAANIKTNRQSMIGKIKGDMDRAEEQLLRSQDAVQTLNSARTKIPSENEVRLDRYEAAFEKISKFSGVTDVNQVTNKIMAQSDTRENLEELSRENSHKIDAKQAYIDNKRKSMDELRYTGIHRAGQTTRKRIDEMEDSLLHTKAVLEQRKARFEAASQLELSAYSGIRHILDKLKPIKPADLKLVALNRDTLPLALEQCQDILVSAYTRFKSEAPALPPHQNNSAWTADAEYRVDPLRSPRDVDENQVLAAMPYNQRVRMHDDGRDADRFFERKNLRLTNGDQSETLDDSQSVGSVESDDDDILTSDAATPMTRSHIKQASKIIMKQGSKQASKQQPSPRGANKRFGRQTMTQPRRTSKKKST